MIIEDVALERSLKTHQFSITVTVSGHELNLWNGIIEHCAKSLSNSELRAVYQACSKQIASMSSDDIPYTFNEMMNELTEAIINRGVFVPSNSKSDPEGECQGLGDKPQ